MHFAPLARCNTFGTLLLLLLPLTSQVLAELEITNVQKLSSPTGLEKDEAVNREKYPILYKTSISRLSNTEIIETQEGLRAYTDPKREWILQSEYQKEPHQSLDCQFIMLCHLSSVW